MFFPELKKINKNKSFVTFHVVVTVQNNLVLFRKLIKLIVTVESLRGGLVTRRININKDEKFRFSGINFAS